MSLDAGTAPVEQAATESTLPVEAPVAAVEQEAPAPERAASEGDLDARLAAIYEKHNPPRSNDGKFQPRDPVEPVKAPVAGDTSSAVQPETQAVEPAKPAIEPPNSWTAEKKAQWAALPPEVQEYVAQRESEQHRQISQLGMKAKAFEPFANVATKHQDFIQRFGLSPDQAFENLLTAARQLQDDPAAFIAHIAQTHGVDLSRFAQPGQEGQPQGISPELMALRREIAELKHREASRDREATTERQRSVESEIEAFSKDKAYWNDLEDDMLTQVAAIRQTAPQMPVKELLSKAYENALYTNPNIRSRILEDQRRADEDKRKAEQEAKAKQAKAVQSVNVSTKPGASPGKPGTWDDSMLKVAQKYGMR